MSLLRSKRKAEQQHLYYLEHKNERLEYRKQYYLNNKTKEKNNNKIWVSRKNLGLPTNRIPHDPSWYAVREFENRFRTWAHRRKNNSIVLWHYSKGTYQCACCGETNRNFLTVDHINNDGYKERENSDWFGIARWLIKNNLPEGIQILCMNCNFARYHNGGTCPHIEIKDSFIRRRL